MTRRARFDPEARRELDEAADFYESEDPGLGRAFLDALERALTQIEDFPESSPVSSGSLRSKILVAFPFSIIYWVADDAVIILAVAHHQRRPGYWRTRAED